MPTGRGARDAAVELGEGVDAPAGGDARPVRGAHPAGPARVVADAPALDGTAGLYGPGSEAWRLDREAFLLLGAGPRALLLQLAHPLVAEGVDQHSNFRQDPWGRLHGTLDSYLRIVYGSAPAATAEIRRLNRLHASVAGPVRDASARAVTGAELYRARDPELSLWVHATLIDSTMTAYDAWYEPLSRERRGTFYRETLPVGRAFGIPDGLLPPDIDAFDAYWRAMLAPDGPVHVTPTARSLIPTILHPPVGPIPPSLYDWLMWPAVALLPPRLRDEYGIPWGPGHAAVAAWLRGAFRLWGHRLPLAWRSMPQARAADRRMRAATIDQT
jgi:uncharacterized protein (DUF2236 family)